MKKDNSRINKAQEIQDEIFKKMSADRRIEIGSQLWQLAKDLINDDKLWRKKIQNIS